MSAQIRPRKKIDILELWFPQAAFGAIPPDDAQVIELGILWCMLVIQLTPTSSILPSGRWCCPWVVSFLASYIPSPSLSSDRLCCPWGYFSLGLIMVLLVLPSSCIILADLLGPCPWSHANIQRLLSFPLKLNWGNPSLLCPGFRYEPPYMLILLLTFLHPAPVWWCCPGYAPLWSLRCFKWCSWWCCPLQT